MKQVLNQLNVFFERVPARIIDHRRLMWILLLLAVIFTGLGIQWIVIDMSLDAFLKKDDPILNVYDQFRETFSSDQGMYIVYEANDGDVLSEESLKALSSLHQELEANVSDFSKGESSPLDHLMEVTSLINASYLEVEEDTLRSRDFVGENPPETQEARDVLRKEALEHPDYPKFYISDDSRFGGILIRTDFGTIPEGEEEEKDSLEFDPLDPSKNTGIDQKPIQFKSTDMAEYAAFNREIEKILQKAAYANAFKFYPVGEPALMGFMNDVIMAEMGRIFAGTLILMAATLWILFRSLSAVVWPLSIVVLSVLMTVGLVGWAGLTMTMMINVLALLMIVVGIADAVHILSGYLFFRRQNLNHDEALKAVYKKSGLACLLTSITTAFGLLSLVFVPIMPIRNFGFSAATGVMLAFFLTIFLLPLMLDLWHPVSRRMPENFENDVSRKNWIQNLISKIVPLATGNPWPVVLIFLSAGVIALYGIFQVKIDSNMVMILKEGLPLRQAYQLVDRYMGGANNMEIYLDFDQSDAMKDPLVLKAIEKAQNRLETRYSPPVVKTSSLVNVVKSTFRALNEDREEMFIIPEDPPMLQQTLLMFETANPEDRLLLVPDDYSRGRITVRVLNAGSMDYVDFIDSVNQELQTIFSPLQRDYPELKAEITGNLGLMMKMIDYISWSQVQSFSIALAVVSFLLLIVFGSKRVGFFAMLPNVFPILVTFGVMGYFEIHLDIDTLIIAPIIIGISVDDTIHFLTHYRAEILAHSDIKKAIIATLHEVGQAITFTSMILITGFLFMLFSSHQGLANFGILSAVAIGTALVADLFLLPAFCQIGKIRFAPAPFSVEAL
ncbi:MAG: RND family transporter [SAR324 cluster bacterium]|nr:RND family transporter [SAR324 cluster bacterium]